MTLNDGHQMPMLGLGVARIPNGDPTERAVRWALEAGYRHFDTAKLYKNEESVGRAITSSAVQRESIWVTTKLWPTDFHHPQKALACSLARLGLDYVDLYLIHRPLPLPIPNLDRRLWHSIESLVDAGLCRSIGVSNFPMPRLLTILGSANIPPAVNQVRCSPFNYPEGLHAFCREHGIALEGYSPLARSVNFASTALQELARKYRKTAAQIMLRWSLQKGIVAIPKSQRQDRIQENARLFDFSISETDMGILQRLNA